MNTKKTISSLVAAAVAGLVLAAAHAFAPNAGPLLGGVLATASVAVAHYINAWGGNKDDGTPAA